MSGNYIYFKSKDGSGTSATKITTLTSSSYSELVTSPSSYRFRPALRFGFSPYVNTNTLISPATLFFVQSLNYIEADKYNDRIVNFEGSEPEVSGLYWVTTSETTNDVTADNIDVLKMIKKIFNNTNKNYNGGIYFYNPIPYTSLILKITYENSTEIVEFYDENNYLLFKSVKTSIFDDGSEIILGDEDNQVYYWNEGTENSVAVNTKTKFARYYRNNILLDNAELQYNSDTNPAGVTKNGDAYVFTAKLVLKRNNDTGSNIWNSIAATSIDQFGLNFHLYKGETTNWKDGYFVRTGDAISGQKRTNSNIGQFTVNQSISATSNYSLYWDYTQETNFEDIKNKKLYLFLDISERNANDYSSTGNVIYRYSFKTQISGDSNNIVDVRSILASQFVRHFEVNNKKNSISTSDPTKLIINGFDKYINTASKYEFKVTESNNDDSSDTNPFTSDESNGYYVIKKYRISETPFDDNDLTIPWIDLETNLGDNNVVVNFQYQDTVNKVVYVQIADNEFNTSKVAYGSLIVHTTVPNMEFLKITGTNGNSNYTGISIDSNGFFEIDNSVKIQFAAQSSLRLKYRIIGDIYDEYLDYNDLDENGKPRYKKWSDFQTFIESENIKTVYLKPNYNSGFEDISGILNADYSRNIQVEFYDEAGNTTETPLIKTIYLNTKLFKTSKRNLRELSTGYDHALYESSTNGDSLISRTDSAQAESVRKWEDIFYPSTHSYPTLADGTIDAEKAISISLESANSANRQLYDAVVLNSNNQIVYDTEGRVSTVWTNSKKYPAMVSSYGDIDDNYAGLTYWIIDNEGYGDIQLEFEHFYLDQTAYGPPYNNMLGDKPDCVRIYDASAEGCVTSTVNNLGQSVYTLKDSSQLKKLQEYTGSQTGVFSLSTGTVNAGSSGDFTTETFPSTRICVMFLSDAANSTSAAENPIGSGFKIKASKKIVKYWDNFNVDNKNGLVWVHKSTTGASVDALKMTYDYYSTSLEIDYDDGAVIFDVKPENDVYADYTYYTYSKTEAPPSRTFLLANDDLVDYVDLNLYVVSSGVNPDGIKTNLVVPEYPISTITGEVIYTAYDGRLSKYFSVDKDRGIVEFNNGTYATGYEFGLTPRGRIFGDYRHHTYFRLGNDGYSNFSFEDTTLVADSTTKYPDYSFGDIKIVNEGDASLEQGQLKFLPRGVVQDGTVKQVLDINRPWDVQMGTEQETYGRTACEIKTQYTWNSYICTKQEAKSILNSRSKNSFPGDLESRGIMYGRVALALGGTSGNYNSSTGKYDNESYPATTAGKKVFSCEVAGKFYQLEV